MPFWRSITLLNWHVTLIRLMVYSRRVFKDIKISAHVGSVDLVFGLMGPDLG